MIIQAHNYLEVRTMDNIGREGILSSKWLTHSPMCIYYCGTPRAYFTDFVLLPHDNEIMNFTFANLSEQNLLILDEILLPCSFRCYFLLKRFYFVSLGYAVFFHYTSALFISFEGFYLACKCLSKSNVIMRLKIIVHLIVNS